MHKYDGLCNTDPFRDLTVVSIIPALMFIIIMLSIGMVFLQIENEKIRRSNHLNVIQIRVTKVTPNISTCTKDA